MKAMKTVITKRWMLNSEAMNRTGSKPNRVGQVIEIRDWSKSAPVAKMLADLSKGISDNLVGICMNHGMSKRKAVVCQRVSQLDTTSQLERDLPK